MALVSYSSISQTVIPNTTNKECAVCLDTIQARAVIKDLVSGDAAKAELKVARRMVDNLQLSVQYHSEQNLLLQEQKGNLTTVVAEKDKQLELMQESIDIQEDQIKKQKKKTLLYKITTGAAIIGGAALLILTN